MTFYIVVEGKRTEKKVFKRWIPALCPALTCVDHPSELTANTFVIVSGMGYPAYLRVVRDAAQDIANNPHFGTLVVSVDAEEDNPNEKYQYVIDVIASVAPNIEPLVIIQNQCIETWALGNRRMVRQFPVSQEHRDWKAHFDVWNLDPEDIHAHQEKGLNRAQTAFAYLVTAIRDRNASLSYSKSNPAVLSDPMYLARLRDRVDATDHIQSFKKFCEIFLP